jgi:hypothetical protein
MYTKIRFSTFLATVICGAVLAQSGGATPKPATSDASVQAIRRYLDSARARSLLPTIDQNMPGAQVTPEHQIVPALAQEVLRLHEQVAALEKEIQTLKANK